MYQNPTLTGKWVVPTITGNATLHFSKSMAAHPFLPPRLDYFLLYLSSDMLSAFSPNFSKTRRNVLPFSPFRCNNNHYHPHHNCKMCDVFPLLSQLHIKGKVTLFKLCANGIQVHSGAEGRREVERTQEALRFSPPPHPWLKEQGPYWSHCLVCPFNIH
uniref:Uncharacterized protein n=1 Tax=Micrurus surinamensis TaxID=129470 RepID=A0A2D4NRE9_MICSU